MDPHRHYPATTPDEKIIYIPVSYDKANDLYYRLKNPAEIRNYYNENGYVVLRNCIPQEMCNAVTDAFNKDIKTFKGYIYRQASANPEKHVYNEFGHILNALMNVQDLNKKQFPFFGRLCLDIFTSSSLIKAIQNILQNEPILTQTMFFEGNPTTWPHQDRHYLDASEDGKMVGMWVALEDIQPGAGRFYVYPESHKVKTLNKSTNITLDKKNYQHQILEIIRENNFRCIAPALKKGDVILFHSYTIHGSLPTSQPTFSRRSLTGHYIASTANLLQFGHIKKQMRLKKYNNILINYPKDQDILRNKILFNLETAFPNLFKKAKRQAIRLLTH